MEQRILVFPHFSNGGLTTYAFAWMLFFPFKQAVRNENDLESMACPVKYRTMNTFWKYYSGEEIAPVPTIFVGGNHEASNYLWEL
jgi:hypothetical protein